MENLVLVLKKLMANLLLMSEAENLGLYLLKSNFRLAQ